MTKKQPTINGYPLDELISALQKDIRRGNEYQAMYWAAQLEDDYPEVLWNRLVVIASEDIGIANSMVSTIIETLRSQYEQTRGKNNDPSRLFLAHAILKLCRTPKSRIVDDFIHVVYHEIQHEYKRLTIPSYALDQHTTRGMKKGKNTAMYVWFNEGIKLKKKWSTSNIRGVDFTR